MPRILLNNDSTAVKHAVDLVSKQTHPGTSAKTNKRSRQYIDFIVSLDKKNVSTIEGWNELQEKIEEEFGSAALSGLPLGIVCKCFLGHPYEVHTIDLSSRQIVTHYKGHEALPAHFENARTLAIHHAYAFVEVYTDRVVLVREDGTSTSL